MSVYTWLTILGGLKSLKSHLMLDENFCPLLDLSKISSAFFYIENIYFLTVI